jgi:septum formation protein
MLQEKLKNHQLILASGSPRRQQFLSDLGLEFSIELKPVEEIYPPELKGAKVAEYLAELKTTPFKNKLKENEILITGDTIVCLDEKVLGKPANEEEAHQMLASLSNRSHEVISSVCLTSAEKSVVFHDVTKVFFKELTTEEISFYIQAHQPYDKAGAYGIQEWIGQIGVDKIEGSYFNVMGMPLHLFYKEILEFIA